MLGLTWTHTYLCASKLISYLTNFMLLRSQQDKGAISLKFSSTHDANFQVKRKCMLKRNSRYGLRVDGIACYQNQFKLIKKVKIVSL